MHALCVLMYVYMRAIDKSWLYFGDESICAYLGSAAQLENSGAD